MAEKQFEPTAERLRKSYREGKSKRSQLFGSAFVSLIVVYGIERYLGFNWVRIQLLIECLWSQQFTESGKCVRAVVLESQYFILSVLGVMMLLSVLIQGLQVGVLWIPTRVLPDFKRISPCDGLSRLSSSVQRLPLELLKVLIAFAAGVLLLYRMVQLAMATEQPLLFFTVQAPQLIMAAAGMLFAFGVHDLFVQRKRFREQVYMDHDEMRREYRESEGDPHMKAHRRSLQQALAREDLIRQIKRSKVLIVERAAGGA